MKVDAAAIAFLRFKTYVHNPTNVYCRPFKAITDWLNIAQDHDPHWSKCSKHAKYPYVQTVVMPAYIHNALLALDCPYRYDIPFPAHISTMITARENSLRLTIPNLLILSRQLGLSMQDFADVFVPYLHQFEINGVQPITCDEMDAMQMLGTPEYIVRSVPLL